MSIREPFTTRLRYANNRLLASIDRRRSFWILGPLEVTHVAGVIALGRPLPRALLAMLLLHANQPMPVGRLAAALWDDEAPAGAGRTLQVYVSRLRKALGEGDRLVIGPAGYLLQARAGELDAERFERRVAEGCAALAARQRAAIRSA